MQYPSHNSNLRVRSSTRPLANVSGRKRGAQVIEAAAVMLVLLPLSLGFLQFAVNYNVTLSVQYVCREAARYASVRTRSDLAAGNSTTAANLIKDKAVVTARSLGLNLRTSDVSVTVPAALTPYDTILPITVSYDMSRRMFFPGRLFGFQIFGSTYSVTEDVVIEGA